MDDLELIKEWTDRGSDDAFRSLVERHVNLVFSVARRSVPTPHQAEEITQTVFIILARKAHTLSCQTILAGWLYRTARYAAAQLLRAESRRQHHHGLATMDTAFDFDLPSFKDKAHSALSDELEDLKVE